MRRVLAPLALLLALVLAPTATAAPRPVGHVVGGALVTDIGQVPWQALVEPGPYLCGGSILDATHVVTAAHCVYDEETGRITAPSEVQVHAGITQLSQTGQHPAVVGVTIDPAYNPYWATGDVAILTLQAPGLTLDGTTVAAIPLTDPSLPALTAGDALRLSGWGATQPRAPDDDAVGPVSEALRVADLHVSSGCDAAYPGFDDDLLLCAGQANLDACQGDSGGPLAVQVGGVWELAGVVNGGAGCGWDGYPGYYARVSNPAIHAFLAQRGEGYTVKNPVNLSPPALTGTPAPGGTLDCDPGAWDDATLAYSVRYVIGGRTIGTTDTTALPVNAGMAGQTVTCVVTGYGLVSTVDASSAPVTIAGGATVPLPAPTAPGAGVTTTPSPATTTPAAPADTKAPKAKVVRSACTRTACRLDVIATDPAPSAGIKAIAGTVTTTYKTTCAHHRRCTRTVRQALKATFVGPGAFRLTTPKLRKGRHVFALVATDLAGHRQAKPTTLTRTTF